MYAGVVVIEQCNMLVPEIPNDGFNKHEKRTNVDNSKLEFMMLP
jgi:hypothetical protein